MTHGTDGSFPDPNAPPNGEQLPTLHGLYWSRWFPRQPGGSVEDDHFEHDRTRYEVVDDDACPGLTFYRAVPMKE